MRISRCCSRRMWPGQLFEDILHVMEPSPDRLHLTLKIYDYLFAHGSTSKNLLISPLSAEMALLMAYIGAKGQTREEIADLLRLNDQHTLQEISSSIMKLRNELDKFIPDTGWVMDETVEYYKLYVANGAFIQENPLFALNEDYKSDLQTLFGATCQNVDFLARENAEEAVRKVNEFVKENTKNIIDNAISTDDVTVHTRLILVNALYFKAIWHYPFRESSTEKKEFTTATGKKVLVDTMFRKEVRSCNYLKSKELDGAIFMQYQYLNGCCSAIFVLPGRERFLESKKSGQKRGLKKWFSKLSRKTKESGKWVPKENLAPDQGLSELVHLLTPEKLLNAVKDMITVYDIKVQLPKFRIEYNLDMKDMLCNLGMPTAFDEELADFSGISSETKLHISKVLQKVYIDVNEKGTEAAAATVEIMENCCWSYTPEKPEFIADRPFLFFIRHDESNTILFVGHVADPSIS